jgi:putative two-component system response regulator
MRQIATFLIVTAALVYGVSRYWFRELIVARQEAAKAKIELVHRLAIVAEWKDDTIGGHNYRIARCAEILAKRLGLSEAECRLIFHGSVLHDIGKVGMPDNLLRKSGRFTDDERKLMERHVLLGAALLDGSEDELLTVARSIALTHHENWDGSGYPQGLKGGEIPLEGRIVAICDVLDALMSRRPYKEAWDDTQAIRYIVEESGRKFDPLIVDLMLEALPELLSVREEVPGDSWVARHAFPAAPSCPTDEKPAPAL